MLNPYLILAIVLLWGASLAGAAWTGKEYSDGQHAKAEVERKRLLDEVRDANAQFADGIAMQTAEAISKIRVTNRTITNEVRHEREVHRVLDNPDCRFPLSTTGLLNRARADGLVDGGPGARGAAPTLPPIAPAPAQPAAPARGPR